MADQEPLSNAHGSEIAIVGIACRFPGAQSPQAFWRNLVAGVDSITEFSDDQLLAAGVDPATLADPRYVRAAPVLDDIEQFDAAFFGYAPGEAALMDPQQRLFLECAWEALEDAGYDPEQHRHPIGVYAGAKSSDYVFYLAARYGGAAPPDAFQIGLGNDLATLATRVSYKLNLKGPSITIQTACSSSLVAVHLACQGLLLGECQTALAGGVAVNVPHRVGYLYEEGSILSRDGRVRAFDAAAQGTVFGSGVGVVALKRLDDALAAGDQIYAVIKGSAVNNDGSAKASFTAPNVDGQARVIQEALAAAQVGPDTLGYIEAHGTGTSIGDPIEIRALTKAFQSSTQARQFCAIGSAKTNVGHLDAAAGMPGLIKAALALKHGQIPPSLHFERPNPQIDFASTPFYVNTELSAWAAGPHPRRAGVSSFGVGSTNAHVILEEAPAAASPPSAQTWHLLPLSARTPAALERQRANLAAHLRASPQQPLADVAHTLQQGRRAWGQRQVLLARDTADALALLEGADPARLLGGAAETGRPVVFLLPGQGAQYPGMAAGLYRSQPVFRQELDRCAELLRPHLGLDLRELLFERPDERRTTNDETTFHVDRTPGTDERRTTNDERTTGLDRAPDVSTGDLRPPSSVHRPEEDAPRLDQTWLTQPAVFAVEYALARLWMSWGVRPQALIGHSLGEYVAAALAGVLGLEDALALVAERGRLMQQLPPGAMLSVELSESELQPWLDDQLSLAAVNAPARTVVAGPPAAVEALAQRLAERGVGSRPLHTSHAFHSWMMDPVLAPLQARLEQTPLGPPRIPYISNLTGTWITEAEATDPRYWARHLRQPVRFADGLRELLRDTDAAVLEVGPGQTLSTLARQQPDLLAGRPVLASLRHPQADQPDDLFALTALGRLWLAGVAVDWRRLYAGERRRRVALPTYPFERQRHWIDVAPAALAGPKPAAAGRNPLERWFYLPSWKRSLPPVPPQEAPAETWLLLDDGQGVAEALAARLERDGHTAVRAARGTAFGPAGERAYTLDPADPEHYRALLGSLRQRGLAPRRIVHLWALDAEAPPAEDLPALQQAQRDGFYSLLFMAQALGEQSLDGPVELAVVANQLHEVTGADPLRPEKSTLLGPVQVIPREYAHIRARSIDVALPPPGQHGRLSALLAAELQAPTADRHTAYRGSQRWVQIFEPAPLEAAPQPAPRLRQRGTYVITGGLGGLGLAFAQHLAERYQARLVLTGRGGLPERAAWDTWLEQHDTHDPASQRIRAVRALEQRGAEVLVCAADVTDPAQMRAVLDQTAARFGAPHGVIHAAGIPGGGIIQLKTRAQVEQIFAPKLAGTLVLGNLLAGAPLDFLLLCSSIQSVLGEFGQVDYCAANIFQDAFAHAYTARHGTLTVAVNWDSWLDVGILTKIAQPAWLQNMRRSAGLDPAAHPLLGVRLDDSDGQLVFHSRISPASHWILDEHRVLGQPVLPGTAYLELARAALAALHGPHPLEIRDTSFLVPLAVAEGAAADLYTLLRPEDGGYAFRVVSLAGPDGQQEHAAGRLRLLDTPAPAPRPVAALLERCPHLVERPAAPPARAEPMQFGPRWDALEWVRRGEREALGLLRLAAPFAEDLAQFALHPALLDVAVTIAGQGAGDGPDYFPFWYGRLALFAPLPPALYSHLRARGAPDGETIAFDVTLLDEQGRVLAEISEFTLRQVESARQISGAAAAAPAPAAPAQAGAGQSGLYAHEGVEALERILGRVSLPQIIVATEDLSATLEHIDRMLESALGEDIEEAQSQVRHARPDLQTPYLAPRNAMEQALAEIWQGLLGVEPVGVRDNFFDLGGDSVLGIRIIARANERGIQITPPQLFRHQTIAELVAALDPSGLGALAEPAPAAQQPDLAPFALADLSEPELEGLQAQAPALEDAYPLSPMQRDMLAHVQRDPHAGVYFLQFDSLLQGDLDVAAFERAWQRVIERYPIFRTRFLWQNRAAPLQLVQREAALVWEHLDWRGHSPTEQRELLDAYLQADRTRGFDFGRAPLLRLALIQRDDDAYQFVWSVHHILIDGWCFSIILQEVFTFYAAFRRGQDAPLELGRPYRDYIAWLQQQPLDGAESFWRRELAGLPPQPPLRADETRLTPREGFDLRDISLDAQQSARLQALARREQLTLNTLIEGVWSLVLHELTGSDDLLFGVTVSGRPTGLRGADSIVGLCANTLPLRVRIDPASPLIAWLRRIQAAQVQLLEYEHSPLDRIREWGGLPAGRPLFESNLRFQNYPVDDSLRDPIPGVRISQFRSMDVWHYPLCLVVTPLDQLLLEITYDRARFDDQTVEHIQTRIRTIIAALLENVDISVADLGFLS